MANVKLSAIAAGTTPAPTDTVIGVQSGTTDAQYTLAQIGASVLKTGNPVVGGTPGSILFIDGSGNLAQDNANFFWDDTNKYLKVGAVGTTGALYINGVPAIYEIPNASGNNWFDGNAGPGPASAMSGFRNFGTGDGALHSLTTGSQNFAIGPFAMGILTSGTDNTAVGVFALNSITTGQFNTAVGGSALYNISSGSGNFGFGLNALHECTTGSSNIAMGQNALFNTPDNNSIGIGVSSLGSLAGGGGFCVAVGHQIANNWASGFANTIIGPVAGFNITGGSYDTLLGSWRGPSASISNVIALTDGFGMAGATYVSGVDYNYTTAQVWSFQYSTTHIGLHIYNTTDGGGPPTNYERGCLDWNLTSNTFRLASQAGGTGVTRLIAIDGFSKAGAPANTDLPSGTFALIDDTTNNQTWLVFNKGGTVRKVQLT